MAMDRITVGKRIRRQREKMSLTREQFAEKAEISARFLGEIETGTKGMTADTLYKICKTTNETADYLLTGKQTTGGHKTPAVELLSKVPPQYSEMLEAILNAFLQTIQVAEREKKEQGE